MQLFKNHVLEANAIDNVVESIIIFSMAVVPNLWPAGQKWPARPQKLALEILKNFKNICARTAKLPISTG